MLKLKRFGKIAVCLLLCVACVIVASPVSALYMTGNSVLTPDVGPIAPEDAVSAQTGRKASYVRYSAYAGSTIIGCLEDGTKITVLGSKSKFYKIDCFDMKGYIAKSQVEKRADGEYYVRCADKSAETTNLPSFSTQEALEMRTKLINQAKKYIGVKYVYGGTSPKGFDCSGYVKYLYNKVGVTLNRTARNQLANTVIIAKEDLQPGDLVIFSNTSETGFASHTSIYIGNGKIIHSGASRGVYIADLDGDYYVKHYQCSRRVVLTDVSVTATLPTMGSLTGGIGNDWRMEE